MTERLGIEIDYCPNCRGVWLDRGELDKMIAKSASDQMGSETKKQDFHPQYQSGNHEYKEQYKHKRKKSFLEDIFD